MLYKASKAFDGRALGQLTVTNALTILLTRSAKSAYC